MSDVEQATPDPVGQARTLFLAITAVVFFAIGLFTLNRVLGAEERREEQETEDRFACAIELEQTGTTSVLSDC